MTTTYAIRDRIRGPYSLLEDAQEEASQWADSVRTKVENAGAGCFYVTGLVIRGIRDRDAAERRAAQMRRDVTVEVDSK